MNSHMVVMIVFIKLVKVLRKPDLIVNAATHVLTGSRTVSTFKEC